MNKVIRGKAYVVRDNIDTDQIIPAQYLNLVPTIPDEYEKLGSFALCGLPKDQYPTRYIPEGQAKTPYTIVIAGRNFGCGSSREHAPIALGAAGCEAAVAESFARIFFRNCINLGIPVVESADAVALAKDGDDVTLDLGAAVLRTPRGNATIRPLAPFAQEILSAGGVVRYLAAHGDFPSVE